MYGPMRRKLYSLCHCWCSKQRIEIRTKYIVAFHFFELFLQDSGSVLQHVTHKDDIPTLRPPVEIEHAKCIFHLLSYRWFPDSFCRDRAWLVSLPLMCTVSLRHLVTLEDANATPFVTRVIHHDPQLSFIPLWVLGNVRAIIVLYVYWGVGLVRGRRAAWDTA